MDKFFASIQDKGHSTSSSSRSNDATAPISETDNGSTTETKLPKGVVLGKDGKP